MASRRSRAGQADLERAIGRRSALGGAALCISGRAFAKLTPTLAIGQDGWIFPAWEDVRHVSLAKSRKAGDLVATAAAALRKANIETCLLLTPMKARIYGEFLPPDFKPNGDFQPRYAQLVDDWRRAGLIVPDLATVFAAERHRRSEPLFFKADLHWTTTGAELGGIEAARAIGERHFLPPSAQPGTRLGPYAVMTYAQNDLARQLPETEFGKIPFETTRYRAPVNGRLDAPMDAAADVAVVGNAFVHPGYTFPTVLSNQLNRPVTAWVKTGRSPYALLLDYLASAAFRKQRARVVVWHLMEGVMDLPPDFTDFWQTGSMSQAIFLSELRKLTTAS